MTDEWDEREIADLADEYELLGELGRGASAVVYRARDRALGRLVAIKVVRAHSIASADDAMLRLAREARTVAKLQHPNIVTVHAVRHLQTGGLALIMQLVPGRTLKEAITEHGAFAPEQAEQVMRDVASALSYAHDNGVIHRDVKPENIFLDAGSGRAMLSDFGIAYSAENESRLTMTGAAIGTPAYMAPEQIDGAPADARSDIYSLGLVTWEMLTGQRPWAGESLFNVISKQKQEQLPAIDSLRPGAVPQRLQYIVERMLQKRAAARWAGADALLANLDHWVVPTDWPQWEAAHRRRREQERSRRAGARAKTDTVAAADQATIRFRRPTTPGGVPIVGAGGTTESNAEGSELLLVEGAANALADDDDETPSWALDEPAPAPRSRWTLATLALAFVTLGGGAIWYANDAGYLNGAGPSSSAASLTANAEPGSMSNAGSDGARAALTTDTMVGQLGDSVLLDTTGRSDLAAGTTIAGGFASDSLAPGALGDREAFTPVEVVPSDSARAAAAAARQRASIAAANGAIASAVDSAELTAPAIRATDDAGVIAAGGRHSCLLTEGRAYCWGANDRGQLGDGDVESRDRPGLVVGDLTFRQISAGLTHTCGVTGTGEAYCWGNDERGQLGDATTTSRSAPVRVNSNLSFRVVRTGSNHSCGLTTGGTVACWGANGDGQLGDGSSAALRSSPVRVRTDTRFVSVTTGWNHSCAIARDGIPWCWGNNRDGQLGDGATTDRNVPQPVVTSERFTSLAAGGNHTCGVTDGGEVHCWGSNTFGQLGTGSTASQGTPTRVASTTRFTSVSAGGVHSCGRTSGGQAWCWGRNTYGQLGDGSKTDRTSPVRVTGSTAFAGITATGAHTCGRTSSGTVSCWGFNVQGQLGDGTRNHLASPTQVALPDG